MLKYARWICIGLLALGLRGVALAQQPTSRLPATKGEVAAKVDTTRFKADSLDKAADIDTLHQIWQWHGGLSGSEITSPYPISFKIRQPKGPADSALTDSTQLAQARHLWASMDSLECVWGEAGDTTSPGLFYYLSSDGTWHRAGPTVDVKAQACAVDSVVQGAQCRFQHRGLFMSSRYQGLWAPGTRLVNDSLTAGQTSPLDTLRSNTKKMQNYATMVDSATGKILIDVEPGFWYTR